MRCKRKNFSILEKLRYREVTGVFDRNVKFPYNKPLFLFGVIPERFHFNIEPVLCRLQSHILMGLTQCGSFLITYSLKSHSSFSDEAIYTLHFWRFSAKFEISLEKEVQLFQGYSVPHIPDVEFAQWPTVPDKLVIFGHSKSVAEGEARIYVTVTSVPSRDKCKDCIMFSSMEDSNTKSCLKHGLTIHTVVSVIVPCVIVRLFIAMKSENRLILNVSSQLHVISFELEDGVDKRNNYYCGQDVRTDDENEELRHNIFQGLMLRRQDNFKMPVLFTPRPRKHLIRQKSLHSDSAVMDDTTKEEKVQRLSNERIEIAADTVSPSKTEQTSTEQFGSKIYEFADTEEHCNLKYKWYRRRTKADKMYEFYDDDNMENIHPLSRFKLLSKKYSTSQQPSNSSTLIAIPSDESGSIIGLSSARESLIVDDRSSRDYNLVDQRSSPARNDKESRNVVATVVVGQQDARNNFDHFASDTETITASPAPPVTGGDVSGQKNPTPTRLALKPCNLEYNANSDAPSSPETCYESFATNTILPATIPLLSASHKKMLGCNSEDDVRYFNTLTDVSTRFHRYYVDETGLKRSWEQMSDESIEGCNELQGAVPLLVFGSGNRKMRLIPSEKEVKQLGVPYCVAVQDTLDMETFCFDACRLICTLEEVQFLSVTNYEAQIADVCPLNGDILSVVYMHVQTGSTRSSKSCVMCKTCCIFIWNPKTGKCSIEAYTPFEPVSDLYTACFLPSVRMAEKLKTFSLGFFGVPMKRKIRILKHRPDCSVKCIRDDLYLICLHKSEDYNCSSATDILDVECYTDEIGQDSDSDADDIDTYGFSYDSDRLF